MTTASELSYQHDGMGRNAAAIRAGGSRVIRGRIPLDVRKELMAAVKAGHLGRLMKDGLKPEIFFHPDHKNGAIARQKSEAEYAVRCIAGVMVSGKQMLEIEDRLAA